MTGFPVRSKLLAPVAFAAVFGVTLVAHADLAPKSTTLGAGVTSGGVTVGPSDGGGKSPNALSKAAADKKSITLGDDSGKTKSSNVLVPPTHTVHKGDTLWDICEHYFGNPWQWPRVWSYNPEILNPHWIYPGEIVRLKKDGSGGITPSSGGMTSGGVVLKPKLVPGGTVFLRNYGFVYDKELEDTGEIIGSPEEKMLLSTFDQVYVRVTKDQAEKLYPGDTLTVFQGVRPVKKGDKVLGNVVQILGTIKVGTVDKKKNFVEGTIVESLDVIERGARVGPVERKIDVVPPKTNEQDIRGVILSSIHANVLYGANQEVLIDKGEDDGLRQGNRIFVVRKGDPWRKGLASDGALTANKITVSSDGEHDVKSIDTASDSPDYPEEVIAEVRVVLLRKTTATCLVTNSQKEIEPGDIWVLKKGY